MLQWIGRTALSPPPLTSRPPSLDGLEVAQFDHLDPVGSLAPNRVQEDVAVVSEGALAEPPDDTGPAEEPLRPESRVYAAGGVDDADALPDSYQLDAPRTMLTLSALVRNAGRSDRAGP